jgi:hypothetical protein
MSIIRPPSKKEIYRFLNDDIIAAISNNNKVNDIETMDNKQDHLGTFNFIYDINFDPSLKDEIEIRTRLKDHKNRILNLHLKLEWKNNVDSIYELETQNGYNSFNSNYKIFTAYYFSLSHNIKEIISIDSCPHHHQLGTYPHHYHRNNNMNPQSFSGKHNDFALEICRAI